jgi:hypothetical protein
MGAGEQFGSMLLSHPLLWLPREALCGCLLGPDGRAVSAAWGKQHDRHLLYHH